MLILIYKNSISNHETYHKKSMLCLSMLGRINVSIFKLIVISKGLTCNWCFINVTNNS